MEKEGELILAAFDIFHPGIVWIIGKDSKSRPDKLSQQNVIKNFEEVNW